MRQVGKERGSRIPNGSGTFRTEWRKQRTTDAYLCGLSSRRLKLLSVRGSTGPSGEVNIAPGTYVRVTRRGELLHARVMVGAWLKNFSAGDAAVEHARQVNPRPKR